MTLYWFYSILSCRSEQSIMASSDFIVAAIDIGTTYSGFAFSFQHKPLNFYFKTQWYSEHGGMVSKKTSTSLLLNSDETFNSFGFEAEDKYASLAQDKKHHDFLFFRKFKMDLHFQVCFIIYFIKIYSRSYKLYHCFIISLTNCYPWLSIIMRRKNNVVWFWLLVFNYKPNSIFSWLHLNQMLTKNCESNGIYQEKFWFKTIILEQSLDLFFISRHLAK